MQIQVNTDKNIGASKELVAQVEATVTKALSRFGAQITRVEVHLSDENGDKNGPDDMRCMIEARLKGLQPTVVTCEAASVAQAVSGAADKLKSSLESTLNKLHEHR